VAAPLLRKRVPAPRLVTQAVAFGAPVGLSVVLRRSRTRDVAVCALQMWAYLAAYKAPHDDEDAQRRRVHLRYPIVLDTAIGCGKLPSVRLQRLLAREQGWSNLDRVLVWAHWIWFAVPHTTLAYILWRHPERFPRAATMTYAVFDIGASFYWLLPTAPPWYAAAELNGSAEHGGDLNGGDLSGGNGSAEHGGELSGDLSAEVSPVRRMMVEYGADFWEDRWEALYSGLGGNPLAAMPSLHFATSMMAALLLAETGPIAGAVGWAYASTLGFALVYLGEHYAVDLLGGAALTIAVRRSAPSAGPALARAGEAIAALGERAREER
jgi:hypothetical protein